MDDDEFIGYTTRTTGKLWEEWMFEEVEKIYKPGTDILDIGANIGTHSLMFSELGNVFAFEPIYHEVTELNIKNNTLKHEVKIHPYALSDNNETVKMFIPIKTAWGMRNYGGTSMYPNVTSIHSEDSYINCQCRILDEVYNGTPSIIKMDVEGAELKVLHGSINIINKHKPALIVEISDYDTSEVGKFIESLGYERSEKKKNEVYVFTHKSIYRHQIQS
tara:strand:+ start:838 stop:1494 length:657 start_codon:yes stop_codon:yes gene_type:complete